MPTRSFSDSAESTDGPFAVRYVVITPVRDEEANLRFTIESMIQQTIRPTEWMIVNDGSTDATGSIIDEFAGLHQWIRAVHRTNRGFRKAGGGVVEAFNDGYQALKTKDWEFVVKFDGDLSFDSNYFEKCFAHFHRDPKLGVGGGGIYHLIDGRERLEESPSFHVRGATKIYRQSCWEAIGGLWPAPGWDTMDEVKANHLGWTTRNFPELRLIHHRLTGTSEGIWNGLIKNGRANYICGYHPLFMLGKCVRRLFTPPYVVGSLALFIGFASGYIKRIPQFNDPPAIAYLRQQQLRKLTGRPTIWK